MSRPDLLDAALRSAGRPAARRPPALCGGRGSRPAMDESVGGPHAASLGSAMGPGNAGRGSAARRHRGAVCESLADQLSGVGGGAEAREGGGGLRVS